MKTPNDIKSWVDMLLSRRPNVEDRNYLEAIKFYMDIVEIIETGFKRDSNLMMDSDDWEDIKEFVEKEAENE